MHSSSIPTPRLQIPSANLFDKVLRAKINNNPFHMFVFNPSLSIPDILELFEGVVDDISQVYHHVTMSKLKNLIQPQDTDSSIDQAARKCIMNALLAVAFHCKADNMAFEDLSPFAWSHLKSAMSIFLYLFLEGSNILVCEAILTMAMFIQGTGDSPMASQLLSSAVRVAQMSLQRRQDDEATRSQSEHQLRVLSTLVSLDIDFSFRNGIPPSVSRDDMAMFLPDSELDQVGEVDVSRYRAQLAKIQLEVYHQLLSDAVRDDSYAERCAKSSVLYQELQTWRKSLPTSMQLIDCDQASSEEIPLLTILLHLVFHNLNIKILSATRTRPIEGLALSARATIDLVQHLPTRQFTVLWWGF